MSNCFQIQFGHVMAVSMALQRSKNGILATLGAVFWSASQGPCTNCLVYGFMEPEIENYPGNGRGRCSNHVCGCCEEPEMSEKEISIQAPIFVAEYENFLNQAQDEEVPKNEMEEKEICKRARRRARAREKRKERAKSYIDQ